MNDTNCANILCACYWYKFLLLLLFILSSKIKVKELALFNKKYFYVQSVTGIDLFIFWLIPQIYSLSKNNCLGFLNIFSFRSKCRLCNITIFLCQNVNLLIFFLPVRFLHVNLLFWLSKYFSVCLICQLLRSYGQFVLVSKG